MLTGSGSTIRERGEYKARPATKDDIGAIAASMRPADQEEVRVLANQSPFEALDHSYHFSTLCRTLCYQDQPLIMYGTTDIGDNSAIVWGLGSSLLDDHVTGFLRMSRPEVQILQGSYDKIFNFVHSKNELHLKWVEFVGFELLDPMPHESGETVVPIIRRS